MTVGDMKRLQDRLQGILQKGGEFKNQRLANLMTDLEVTYAIPLFGKDRIAAFEEGNPFVLQLYRAVSSYREF